MTDKKLYNGKAYRTAIKEYMHCAKVFFRQGKATERLKRKRENSLIRLLVLRAKTVLHVKHAGTILFITPIRPFLRFLPPARKRDRLTLPIYRLYSGITV